MLSSNSGIVFCTDSIESNVETAAVDVRQGAVELSKAKDYQVLLPTPPPPTRTPDTLALSIRLLVVYVLTSPPSLPRLILGPSGS